MANGRPETVLAAGLVLLLAGCASPRPAPVHVVAADANSIQVAWNGVQVSEPAARSAAVLHCAPYRVQEVDSSRRPGLGLQRSTTWQCVSP